MHLIMHIQKSLKAIKNYNECEMKENMYFLSDYKM